MALLCTAHLRAQVIDRERLFEQMDGLLPAPNQYRTAAGSPGAAYWQQWVDYEMHIELHENTNRISGQAQVVYHNRAPETLHYVWLHLDQNIRKADAAKKLAKPFGMPGSLSSLDLRAIVDGDSAMGFNIAEVRDTLGNALNYSINHTMMRIELSEPLKSGSTAAFDLRWDYKVNDRGKDPGRSGMEFFVEDGNYQYNIAQFYPRVAVYSDTEGWQNKQYLGAGEFSLPFGRFTVAITTPADHIVGATGTLRNRAQVLTTEQRQRLRDAENAQEPVYIVTPEEAYRAEKSRSNSKKTWIFTADSVRDFAFVSSRKLIWDAMGLEVDSRKVMVMSMYTRRAEPLYSKYATRAAAHTVRFYSDYLFPYPYPVALVVEADMGMEYPMVAFTYGRADANGNYSEWLKRAMISVVIHEVGHNYFPMVINSDERRWAWMDEGLTSFVQYLAEQAWELGYPSRRGPPQQVIRYMRGHEDGMVPIMTNPEQLKQKGNNAYLKTATALNILRETIMGRELFDYAFRTFCRRWAFKHPTPADFFRSMEDASAVDLDWFWKGWFYTTDAVDIELANVTLYKYVADPPARRKEGLPADETGKGRAGRKGKDAGPDREEEAFETFEVTFADEPLPDEVHWNFYEVHLRNKGGLVMPVLLKFHFTDGTSESRHIPAEIWRYNTREVRKVFAFPKRLKSLQLDPEAATADIDPANNVFPGSK